MRWLDSITDSTDMNLTELQRIVKDRGAWHAAVHGAAKSRTQLSDWTPETELPCAWSSLQPLSTVSVVLSPTTLYGLRGPLSNHSLRSHSVAAVTSQHLSQSFLCLVLDVKAQWSNQEIFVFKCLKPSTISLRK